METGKGAETILRALLDNDEGVQGASKRRAWVYGQPPGWLQQVADACSIFAGMCQDGLEAKRRGAD